MNNINAKSIKPFLPGELKGINIITYDVTDSTNNRSRELDEELLPAVIIAREQTAGKGRLGRKFQSSTGGIYMSVAFRPEFDISRSGLATVATAVSVAKAIDSVMCVHNSKACADTSEICAHTSMPCAYTSIKWVNDIYMGELKICGILAEADTDPKTGELDRLVVGIGINTVPYSFSATGNSGTNSGAIPLPGELSNIAGAVPLPGELSNIAGAVPLPEENYAAAKAMLIAEVLKNLHCYIGQISRCDSRESNITQNAPLKSSSTAGSAHISAAVFTPGSAGDADRIPRSAPEFMDIYREKSNLIGKEIFVYKGVYRKDPSIELGGISARATGIDDEGGLQVVYDDGTEETLNTGEVSVRFRDKA